MKEKRIKKTVMVVATFMILASFVLVGVSLSMSDHIDEMGELLRSYSTALFTTFMVELNDAVALLIRFTRRGFNSWLDTAAYWP